MEVKVKFSSEAEAALEMCGFSLGRLQRGDPRGVMFGDFDIQKWRNLTVMDKAGLHGVYQRNGRGGPVTVTLSRNCPDQAQAAIAKELETRE